MWEEKSVQSYIGVGFLTLTFLFLFKSVRVSTIASVILQTSRTVGNGFALFVRLLTSFLRMWDSYSKNVGMDKSARDLKSNGPMTAQKQTSKQTNKTKQTKNK